MHKPTQNSGARAGHPLHPASFESRIRDQYETLPDSERKIADLILEFPGEVAAYSATELATLAKSSKAAVTRLIRRLGFSGFEQARRAARDSQNWGSPLYLMPRHQRSKATNERIDHHIEQDIQVLSQTFKNLNKELLNDITKGILKSQRVYILGFRNSYYLAGYFRLQLIQARPDVHLLPAAGETVAEHLAGMTTKDILIVIGFRRRVTYVTHVMNIATNVGSRVLYITDSTAARQPKATWTLYCTVRGDDVFDRYPGAISLLHFLSVSVMAASDDKGRARLKAIEHLHEVLDEFD